MPPHRDCPSSTVWRSDAAGANHVRHWFEHNCERISATVGDGVAAGPPVIGAIGGDRGDGLVCGNLRQKTWQHERIADAAAGDRDGPDLHVRRGNAPPGPFLILLTLVDGEVDLAPDAARGSAMLAGVPFSFASDLDARAVRCPAGSCEA